MIVVGHGTGGWGGQGGVCRREGSGMIKGYLCVAFEMPKQCHVKHFVVGKALTSNSPYHTLDQLF